MFWNWLRVRKHPDLWIVLCFSVWWMGVVILTPLFCLREVTRIHSAGGVWSRINFRWVLHPRPPCACLLKSRHLRVGKGRQGPFASFSSSLVILLAGADLFSLSGANRPSLCLGRPPAPCLTRVDSWKFLPSGRRICLPAAFTPGVGVCPPRPHKRRWLGFCQPTHFLQKESALRNAFNPFFFFFFFSLPVMFVY